MNIAIDTICGEMLNAINTRDPYATDERDRRAVDRYALDILANYTTMTRRADIDADTREQLKRALLIGATDWNEYARVHGLRHSDAIARRIGDTTATESDYIKRAFEHIATATAAAKLSDERNRAA